MNICLTIEVLIMNTAPRWRAASHNSLLHYVQILYYCVEQLASYPRLLTATTFLGFRNRFTAVQKECVTPPHIQVLQATTLW